MAPNRRRVGGLVGRREKATPAEIQWDCRSAGIYVSSLFAKVFLEVQRAKNEIEKMSQMSQISPIIHTIYL